MEPVSTAVTYYENYTPVGDVTVLGMCMVLLVLMKVAYNVKNKNYRMLQAMIGCLMVSTISSMVYHILLNSHDTVPVVFIYITRGLMHVGFLVIMYLYVRYVMYPLQLDERDGKIYVTIAHVGLVLFMLYDVLGTVTKLGYYITDDGDIHEGFKFFFSIAYFFFFGLVSWLLLHFRGRIIRQLLYGIIGTLLISITMMGIQGSHGQMSFTSVCFLFPIITLFYMIHSNPYNIEIGSVNVDAFEDMVTYAYRRHESRYLMCLYMPEFEGTGKHYPPEIQRVIRKFAHEFFKNAVLFQISNGRMALVIRMENNPDYQNGGQRMLENFYGAYHKFHLDYKIVYLPMEDEISAKHDYLRFLKFVEKSMEMNTAVFAGEQEFADFHRMNYVLSQLEDIKRTGDLNDPRVEVYCQPVLNIATGKYDTAEALMRMRLPETGMVFPDVFIPIAEENGYIHTLSLIILFKTCLRIKKMMAQGYYVLRISVNFSVSELRDPSFCEDINRIIKDVGIPHDKIAIEITESQNESEFRFVKDRINELRQSGIKFYLDDFGTGYSNFERIMELPFDIIKFDRSLVIACGTDEKSEKMVSHLAGMFAAMNYSVLYEGIETEQDEEKCIRMSARYLQGYKYSKPIPIEELTNWFDKEAG